MRAAHADRGEGRAGIEVAGEHPGERAEWATAASDSVAATADQLLGSALGPMRSSAAAKQARLPDPAVADEHGADSAALDEGELHPAGPMNGQPRSAGSRSREQG